MGGGGEVGVGYGVGSRRALGVGYGVGVGRKVGVGYRVGVGLIVSDGYGVGVGLKVSVGNGVGTGAGGGKSGRGANQDTSQRLYTSYTAGGIGSGCLLYTSDAADE